MKRAQLYLKNAAGRTAGPRECPPQEQRRLWAQLDSVGWAEPATPLRVAAARNDPLPPVPLRPDPSGEASQAERVLHKYFGCAPPSIRPRRGQDPAAERRRAWEDAVVARHLLPETGAELLVLEGIKHIQ
ncbi:MAG TPA: hypothetical protein VK009_13635 [Chloroflexota bacterium]|nr:hypothetical protein [Chloroflexota bacterium]